ncbi:MAG: hypothetical protein VX152_12090, partial [Pseudomonadota bacterium]|nr:hypothetical protein [Pseudomonadota bacterium]
MGASRPPGIDLRTAKERHMERKPFGEHRLHLELVFGATGTEGGTKKVGAAGAEAEGGAAAAGGAVARLEAEMMHASLLLEAVGNAKTIRNNNSSRFGRYCLVRFGDECEVVGAQASDRTLTRTLTRTHTRTRTRTSTRTFARHRHLRHCLHTHSSDVRGAATSCS